MIRLTGLRKFWLSPRTDPSGDVRVLVQKSGCGFPIPYYTILGVDICTFAGLNTGAFTVEPVADHNP
jgi:hypothetical protein